MEITEKKHSQGDERFADHEHTQANAPTHNYYTTPGSLCPVLGAKGGENESNKQRSTN